MKSSTFLWIKETWKYPATTYRVYLSKNYFSRDDLGEDWD
jgi:hypothetical protein